MSLCLLFFCLFYTNIVFCFVLFDKLLGYCTFLRVCVATVCTNLCCAYEMFVTFHVLICMYVVTDDGSDSDVVTVHLLVNTIGVVVGLLQCAPELRSPWRLLLQKKNVVR